MARVPDPVVALLRVRPESILEDVDRLCELGRMRESLAPGKTTILKDNISWHFPFPGANTTPWQLEGTILALKARGFDDQICVANKTVVTNTFKGEDLNNYNPIFARYGIPVVYNFKPEHTTWNRYTPRAKMRVLDRIYPDGIYIPDCLPGRNIIQLPTVKCVAGDTEVMLADGSVVTIAELVAKQLREAKVCAIGADGERRAAGRIPLFAKTGDGKIEPCEATVFWKTRAEGRRILRLVTRTGRRLTATADHLVQTASGWRPLGDLAVGERMAIARRMSVAGASQSLPRTHARLEAVQVTARAGRKYSAPFVPGVLDQYQAGATTAAIAANAGIRWQVVQAILKRHRVPMRRNVRSLQIPRTTSPQLWRWIGYVMAEGCIERGKSTKLWWSNTDPILCRDFASLTEELFGLDVRAYRGGPKHYVYSRDLVRFLEEIGLPIPLSAGNKRIPPMLLRCPDDEVAAFLSAYLDGDGTLASKQADLSVTTKSEQLARDVQTLFTRLGVVAFLRPVMRTIPGKWAAPRRYYMVTVSGENLIRLQPHLRLRHVEKARRLERHVERVRTSKQSSNWDTVPVRGVTMRAVRVGLGLSQAATGHAGAVNNVEREKQLITPRILREVLDRYEEADAHDRFGGELGELRQLAAEDLAWDFVASIEPVEDDDLDLFDLTVPGAATFVGNGLVLHNCHIYTTTTGAMKNAFGGLLHNHRHYTHSWIHETLVDLLAIQQEIHPGLFAIMDGTTAGNGPGPRTMYPEIKNVMLASADQVAIDAVAAKLMGFDPLSIDYIRLAHEAGLGMGDFKRIEIVGDTEVAKESWGFKVGDNGASRVGDLMWFGPLKRFQKLFFHTPLVHVFVAGSEAYHDYYRWPLRDRAVFERWRATTPWGRLFERYSRGESLAAAAGAERSAAVT